MDIRFNSSNTYTASNNKPKVAFGNLTCEQALMTFHERNTSETNRLFRIAVKRLDNSNKPAFINYALQFIKDHNPKPYIINRIKTELGI